MRYRVFMIGTAARNLYANALKHHLLTTNVATAGVIGFSGDILAQRIERHKADSTSEICLTRSIKVASWIALFTIPFTRWFSFLDTRFPTPSAGRASTAVRLRSVLKKVALNQCFAAPLNNGGFYAWIVMCNHAHQGVLEGKSFAPPSSSPTGNIFGDIQLKLKNDLPKTMANSIWVWGSAWTVSILYMPPSSRVLFNSVGQFFWVAYLSLIGHKRDI